MGDQTDRPDPIDLDNGETAIDPAGGADDAQSARREAAVMDEHTTQSDDPTDSAGPRPDPGPSTPATGPG